MSLQSLVMEDLQHEPNSKHRFMMLSSVADVEQQTNVDFISTSCPDLASSFSLENAATTFQTTKLTSSLPDYLEMETVFAGFDKKSRFEGEFYRYVALVRRNLFNRNFSRNAERLYMQIGVRSTK